MSTGDLSIALESDSVVLERGELRVEIELQPFSMTVRRRGRKLLRAAGAWVAQGTVHDHFIQFTEGVIALQIHTGGGVKMRWKDIYIKEK